MSSDNLHVTTLRVVCRMRKFPFFNSNNCGSEAQHRQFNYFWRRVTLPLSFLWNIHEDHKRSYKEVKSMKQQAQERKKNALAKASTSQRKSSSFVRSAGPKEETWRWWHWINVLLNLIYEFMFSSQNELNRPENKWMFTETWEIKSRFANRLHLHHQELSDCLCNNSKESFGCRLEASLIRKQYLRADSINLQQMKCKQFLAFAKERNIFIRKFKRVSRTVNESC